MENNNEFDDEIIEKFKLEGKIAATKLCMEKYGVKMSEAMPYTEMITKGVEVDKNARNKRLRKNIFGTIVVCAIVFMLVKCYNSCDGTRDVKGGLDTTALVITAEVEAHSVIEEGLKAPSTADFTREMVYVRSDTVTVTGCVDAQNSFGAMVRSRYYVVFDTDSAFYDSKNWRVIESRLLE